MTIKPGDLVKYKSTAVQAAAAPLVGGGVAIAHYKFNWTWQQCADNLIGLVTKIEDDKIYVHWFCLNKTIWEYEDHLKKVSS